MGTFATGKTFFVMKFQTYRALLQDIHGVPGGMCQTSGECSLC